MLKNKFILGGVGAKWQSKGIISEGGMVVVEIIFPIHILFKHTLNNIINFIKSQTILFLLHIIISLKKDLVCAVDQKALTHQF